MRLGEIAHSVDPNWGERHHTAWERLGYNSDEGKRVAKARRGWDSNLELKGEGD